MWRERIIETRKAKGITIKMMAERTPSHITAETITRILNEKNDPRISTVLELGESVGLSPWELFAEPTALLAYQGFVTLQAEVDALAAENDSLKNESKNLKDKVVTLEAENDHLRLTLAHKEETLTHKEEIIVLQKQLIDLQKTGYPEKNVWKL